MAKDRISVNVANLSGVIDLDHPDAVHPVALSHLGEYFAITNGEDIPHDPANKRLSERLLGSLAILSTDDELERRAITLQSPNAPDVLVDAYIAHWIKLMSPVVGRTRAVGKRLDGYLDPEEHGVKLDDTPVQDFLYLVGLFDITSFVIAQQLSVEHPRMQLKNLTDQAIGVTPLDFDPVSGMEDGAPLALDLMINLPILPAQYRHQLRQLKLQGEAIVQKTEEIVGVVQTVLNDVPE